MRLVWPLSAGASWSGTPRLRAHPSRRDGEYVGSSCLASSSSRIWSANNRYARPEKIDLRRSGVCAKNNHAPTRSSSVRERRYLGFLAASEHAVCIDSRSGVTGCEPPIPVRCRDRARLSLSRCGPVPGIRPSRNPPVKEGLAVFQSEAICPSRSDPPGDYTSPTGDEIRSTSPLSKRAKVLQCCLQ